MEIIEKGEKVLISGICCCDLQQIANSGQCFRWTVQENGFVTVAHGKVLFICQSKDGLLLENTNITEVASLWANYFDLHRDYEAVKIALSKDTILKNAMEFGSGLRILNQDLWEMTVTFILSANNNIPRIKKILELLCQRFGDKLSLKEETYYALPRPEQLALLSVEDLSCIRAGFRAKYLLDAARKFADGEISPLEIQAMDYAAAQQALKKIKGVGDKVADCILLFGAGKMEAFPVDVWIKKALLHFYGSLEVPAVFGCYNGIAQQYLYYYARENRISV